MNEAKIATFIVKIVILFKNKARILLTSQKLLRHEKPYNKIPKLVIGYKIYIAFIVINIPYIYVVQMSFCIKTSFLGKTDKIILIIFTS